MKLTLYNGKYSFSEIIDDEYIEQFIPLDYPDFDCLISEIKTDHPFLFGWLEDKAQGTLSWLFQQIEFTHIKFTNEKL